MQNKIDCTYLHLGSGSLENEEKKLADILGVNNKINFVGNTTHVRDYLIASDVYIMTSKFEGLGNAAVEAMACQLPLILYDVPGLKDLINNDDSGLLIKENHEDLVNAILYLEKNISLRKELGENAYNKANSNFNLESNVKKIINLYGM